jgi:predicted small secreted protein
MRALSMTIVLLAALSLAGCSNEVKGEKGDVGRITRAASRKR